MPYDDANPRPKVDPDQQSQSGKAATPPEKPDPKDQARRRRKPFVIAFLVIVAIAAIAGGVIWWVATKNLVSTDDAYTDGRAIMIAPQVAGYVTDLLVTDNQRVHAGDLLLKIDDRDYIAARDQAAGTLAAQQGQLEAARAALSQARVTYPAKLEAARAQLLAQQATLTRTQEDYRRQTSVSAAATTRQNIDAASAALRQAEANVAEAQANVAQATPVADQISQTAAQVHQLEGQVAQATAQLAKAELDLSRTRVVAPQDGWVTQRNVEKGNWATSGSAVMSLVSPQIWITANYKETQLDRLRPGQQVDITLDAYPELKLHGHVDSVQRGSGSRFSAFPAENATGNYVKIVQRIPVKIDIDSGLDETVAISLGLSANPTIHVQ